MDSLLIKRAQLTLASAEDSHKGLIDLKICRGIIAEIGPNLSPTGCDTLIDAQGGALLPGLHDHHIHLLSLAASLQSLPCGPPDVNYESELISALRQCNDESPQHWLRGTGYHSCIAGDINRHWLDQWIPDRPVRIQHRSGRLWVLNSCALETLGKKSLAMAPIGLEKIKSDLINSTGNQTVSTPTYHYTGRLYEADQWLRQQLSGQFPSIAQASQLLASYGITGITDTSPNNGPQEWQYFKHSQKRRELLQSTRLMGNHKITFCSAKPMLKTGEYKIHLRESQLPDFDKMCKQIVLAHRVGQAVAIHCVTLAELVYALSALESSGVIPGDRIEHASITPPTQRQQIKKLGLRVVTQPHFVAERGDQYLAEVALEDQPWLYCVSSFVKAGIPLAAGSDAPFGNPNPWLAMRAAVTRKTTSGLIVGKHERITPEQALALFLSPADRPGGPCKRVTVGLPADLCLLSAPWGEVRNNLDSQYCRLTMSNGKIIFQR
ncbi:MAG: amidohydrolase family protein [Gammaproteobacteria bacterium]|nr:amidohydrolase family protein [Gammaproteobacteria bacterium]